jgi:hypothetical protein
MQRTRYQRQLNKLSTSSRRAQARQKFLLGLGFEQAGLFVQQEQVLQSEQAYDLCQRLLAAVQAIPWLEHQWYRLGQATFHCNKHDEKAYYHLWGQKWQQQRYHHLVRLGGDIARTELVQYPPATILGALCWIVKNEPQ